MTTPGISVIIPAYNAGLYLGEAIDSVLRQQTPAQQVIVVDDGSTDDTAAIARSFGNHITVVEQSNLGSSSARNRGLGLANQPLIAFVDADDRWTPDKLERQVDALLSEIGATLCICRVCDFWSPEMPEKARRPLDLTPQWRPGQVTTWLARRALFETVGEFNMTPAFRYAEGSEIYSRIESANVPVVRIEDCLVERRLHASNKSANSKAHLGGVMALMKKRLELKRGSA